MTRIALCCFVLLLGCTHSEKVSSPTGPGKPTAPVVVWGELTASSAHLTLRSEADAKDLKVIVTGVDGLTVQSEATLFSGTALARGEARSFDVAFRPGPGQSQLVLSVEGVFDGAHRSRVVSFAVGTRSAAQERGEGTVITTDDGQKLKLMPSGQ